ncbi:hypothetical protein D9M72_428090 [compost metagenome]
MQVVGAPAHVRGYVVEDDLLAEVEADHVGHVRIDRLVVRHASADRIADGHVAGTVDRQQAGRAERGIVPEHQRIEEVVVDAPVDHVDALRPLRGAHEQVVVLDEQVAAFDQLHAHLLRQEGVLEVRRVVHARGQHHHRGIGDRLRRYAAQHVEQQVGIVRHRRDAVAREQVGEQPHHHLAVFQHVRHPGGHAQVVFQHVELALAGTHHVDAGDVRIDVMRYVDAEHLGPVLGVVVDLVGWDHAGADDVLAVVDIVDKAVERGHALAQALFQQRPFAGREDARDHVERDGALGAAVGFVLVAIDSKGNAHAPENQVRLGPLVVHGAAGLPRQPVSEMPVMRAYRPVGQCLPCLDDRGRTVGAPVQHLVEKPPRHDGRSSL